MILRYLFCGIYLYFLKTDLGSERYVQSHMNAISGLFILCGMEFLLLLSIGMLIEGAIFEIFSSVGSALIMLGVLYLLNLCYFFYVDKYSVFAKRILKDSFGVNKSKLTYKLVLSIVAGIFFFSVLVSFVRAL